MSVAGSLLISARRIRFRSCNPPHEPLCVAYRDKLLEPRKAAKSTSPKRDVGNAEGFSAEKESAVCRASFVRPAAHSNPEKTESEGGRPDTVMACDATAPLN